MESLSSLNNIGYGVSVALSGYRGPLEFVADGLGNWVSDNYIPEIGPLSVTGGAGLGGGPSISLGSGSTVHSGHVSFTTSSSGSPNAVALSFNFIKGTFVAPYVCLLSSQNGTAFAVAGFSSTPTTSGWSWTSGTAWPAGSYVFGYSCQF